MAPTTAPQTAPQTAAQTAPRQPQHSPQNPHLLEPLLSSLHLMVPVYVVQVFTTYDLDFGGVPCGTLSVLGYYSLAGLIYRVRLVGPGSTTRPGQRQESAHRRAVHALMCPPAGHDQWEIRQLQRSLWASALMNLH
jgi:hypothetical protein